MRRVFRIPLGRTPKRQLAREVDDELCFHLETRVERLVASGWEPEAARGEALRQFGDVDAVRQDCVALDAEREGSVRRSDLLADVRQDLLYAMRSFRRSPGWTAVALITIALGVGSTTTMFRIADTLLIRPIAYPDASRVFVLRREYYIGTFKAHAPMSPSAVRAWQSDATSIEMAAPFVSQPHLVGTGPEAATVTAAEVGVEFLALAGARPLIGRAILAGDVVPNAPAVVVLAEDYWRREYGASPDVIGKVVQVDSAPHTIVGVLPGSLILPELTREKPSLWLPLILTPDEFIPGVAVRLRPGVSPEAAIQELRQIFARSQIERPWYRDLKAPLLLTRPQDDLRFRRALVMLTGAVALLLLVACTNVTHLLLARGATRQRELAVRHALGAARLRLVRQLVTESVLLAAMGGALATIVGWAGLRILAAARPERLAELSYVSGGRGLLSTTTVLAIAAGLAIGVVSALRSAHRDVGLSLRSGASSALATGRRLRAWLVVGEVSLSATLLVGALLLIHAVFDLQATPLGFDARGLYTVSLQERQAQAGSRAGSAALLRARAARIPGVERLTVAGRVGMGALSLFETPERPAPNKAPEDAASPTVAADYFPLMGIPLVAGRNFDNGSAARHEVIVSRSLALELWPSGSAIGGQFRNSRAPRMSGAAERWQTVIGVVPDVVEDLLTTNGQLAVYRPFVDSAPGRLTLIIRLHGTGQAASLSRFAKSLGPDFPMPKIESVQAKLDLSIAEPRFTMLILVAFAALGVVLAAIGLFGVISYSVGQRTREIGIRMTLGATRDMVARLVIGEGIRLAVLGIAVGLVGAAAATRLIQSMLYGVSRFDPFSFGMGALVLVTVSVLACVAPMLRATSVDPVIAIRAD